jgi:hypothetical protein
MIINKLIIDSLGSLNIPVTFQKYSGNSEEYITFHEYYSEGEAHEDDEEALTSHYIQVDVWTKSDYTILVDNIRNLLIEAGFKRLNESDLYEEISGIYHKIMKFYFLEGK